MVNCPFTSDGLVSGQFWGGRPCRAKSSYPTRHSKRPSLGRNCQWPKCVDFVLGNCVSRHLKGDIKPKMFPRDAFHSGQFCEILQSVQIKCGWKKSCTSCQIVCPTMYKVWYIGFLPSTLSFNTAQVFYNFLSYAPCVVWRPLDWKSIQISQVKIRFHSGQSDKSIPPMYGRF